MLAALTFAAAALPVVVTGGVGAWGSIAVALMLAAIFTLGTVLVHDHLITLRRRDTQAPRLAAFLLGSRLSAGVWVLAGRAGMSWIAGLTTLPMTFAGLAIWLFPPVPWRLKAVGWTAASCALAGGSLAVAGLR